MLQWFLSADSRLQVGIIAVISGFVGGLIGPALKHLLDRWALTHKLEAEYEYEQRKKLRTAMGLHKGRTLEAAERLNHRLWNLRSNEAQGWLAVGGSYGHPVGDYYFSTTVHRFLGFIALCRKFEAEALFIDARIAKDNELLFLKFVKALEWSVTDVALFKGLDYDSFYHTDHFFRDKLRLACDWWLESGDPLSLTQWQNALIQNATDHRIKPVLEFFDGISISEERLRWDRLVAFHCLLMTFINAFGYDVQRTSVEQLTRIAGSIQHRGILENVLSWLPKLGLSKDKSVKELQRAIRKAIKIHQPRQRKVAQKPTVIHAGG